MKRGSKIALTLLGITMLAACDNTPEKETYADVPACVAAGERNEFECRILFENAQVEHEKSAPKFKEAKSCEEEFGVGRCQAKPQADGSNIFIPLMMGYMIGNMMNSGGGMAAQPLYQNDNDRRRGTYSTYAPVTSGSSGNISRSAPAYASTPVRPYSAPAMVAAGKGFSGGSVATTARGGYGGIASGGFSAGA